MEREQHCKDCGFDFAALAMSVLYAGRGVDGVRRALHCPICRAGPVNLAVERLAFPRGEASWVRWREAGASSEPGALRLGRLSLRIDARVETLAADEICFRAVPLFESDGARVVPALPVRPEFVDCLDPQQLAIAQKNPERFGRLVIDGTRARFRCTIPLRGLREHEWPTVECDVLPSDPRASTAGDVASLAFRGVSMQLWPNLARPTRDWKMYVAAIGAPEEAGMRLFAQGRNVRASLLVPRDGAFESVAFEPRESAWLTSVCTTGRPAWVALSFHDAAGEIVGGGLFAVPPAHDDAQRAGECSLGLDFGTTNTVVSIKQPDGTVACVSPERERGAARTTLHLLRPENAGAVRGPEFWPGGAWSGPFGDLLPSEMVCAKPWTDVASREAIERLVFGRDFGIPLGASDATPDRVVSEFKWLRALQREKTALAHHEVVEALQARYLEAALLTTLAAILSESPQPPRTVTVYYAYPLAFEDGDLRTLERATARAEARLKELTGADFKFLEAMDEAQAAAGSTGANKMFRVCLDLGGGSFEVLVDDTWARHGKLGHQGLHPHVFSTSVFFGGGVYLRSLLGDPSSERKSACVLPAMSSYTRLASALRRWDSARTLIESPDVLAEARKPTAVRRARVFFAGAVELVARTLAGLCLEHGRTRDGAMDLSRNRLFTLTTTDGARKWVLGTPVDEGRRSIEFSLVLVGNGWGFGEIIRDGTHSVEAMVSQRVRIRLLELLRESSLAREIHDGEVSLAEALDDDGHGTLSIDVTSEAVRGGHRKARVARGLLEAQDRPQGAQGHETRANGRHGVLGFDLRVTDAGRTVPWFRPFGPQPPERPELIPPPIEEKPSRAGMPELPRAATLEPPRAATGWTPFAPTAPTWTPFAPPSAPPSGTLESFVWLLTQQWGQIVAAAAQNGIAPFEFATRQLWGQVLTSAQAQNVPPEQWLAQQRWEQLRQTGGDDQERWRAIAAQAHASQRSPEAVLAAERWEQLMATLARSVPIAMGPLPPPPPFPFDPKPRS